MSSIRSGLPFEHYDGIGRWRDDDRGMALDVSGELDGTTFNGVPEMARLLSEMPDVRACYVAEWLRFSQGKLNSDSDQAVRRLADDAVHAQHAR